jgi:outer membrane protein
MKSNQSCVVRRQVLGRSLGLWAIGAASLCAVTWMLTPHQTSAQPAPTRIAVIDVQRVLTQSTAGKAATAKIKELQDARLARARVLDEELRKLSNDLAAAGITPARRANLELQIADKRIVIQRFAEDADKEIATTRSREVLALEARIKPVVDGIGKEMGLAAIFNKFESGLVFVHNSLDITDTVVTRFNAAPAAQPAPRD